MKKITVPSKEDVSSDNQAIFDTLQKKLGMVPNLYAVMAYSDTGLSDYLNLQNRKTSLSNKEKEAVNLVVSQVNQCRYCQSAHTVLGKMNGLSEDQMIEIRQGQATFDSKMNSLVGLAKEITVSRGNPSEDTLSNFFDQGYTHAHLVDLVIAVADKVVMNYLHNITQVPIDFPEAPELEPEKVW